MLTIWKQRMNIAQGLLFNSRLHYSEEIKCRRPKSRARVKLWGNRSQTSSRHFGRNYDDVQEHNLTRVFKQSLLALLSRLPGNRFHVQLPRKLPWSISLSLPYCHCHSVLSLSHLLNRSLTPSSCDCSWQFMLSLARLPPSRLLPASSILNSVGFNERLAVCLPQLCQVYGGCLWLKLQMRGAGSDLWGKAAGSGSKW